MSVYDAYISLGNKPDDALVYLVQKDTDVSRETIEENVELMIDIDELIFDVQNGNITINDISYMDEI